MPKTPIRIDSNYINRATVKELEKSLAAGFLELAPSMAARQKKIGFLGKVLEDGNYFDLFVRARDNYILGWFSSTLILSRVTAEQLCIGLLEGGGLADLKWESKVKQKQKTLDGLIAVCKTKGLLTKQQPLKLGKIKAWSEAIIHAKGQLKPEARYEANAFSSLEFLGQIISERFNYVAKAGRVSGYKYQGQTKRL